MNSSQSPSQVWRKQNMDYELQSTSNDPELCKVLDCLEVISTIKFRSFALVEYILESYECYTAEQWFMTDNLLSLGLLLTCK